MTERFELVEKALIKMLEEKKFATLRDILVTINPADIAAMFDSLEDDRIPILFRLLPKETAAHISTTPTIPLAEYVFFKYNTCRAPLNSE